MQLKDTLPNAPLLVKLHDEQGRAHSNYAEISMQLLGREVHMLVAHYTDFLPTNQRALKERIGRFVSEIFMLDEAGTPLPPDQNQEYTNKIYDALLADLKRNPDIKVISGSETDSIKTITIPPVLANAESKLRCALPYIAKNAGILLEPDTDRMPQIVITDAGSVASVVPRQWECSGASGYAQKFSSLRESDSCDAIYVAINQPQLYQACTQKNDRFKKPAITEKKDPAPIAPTEEADVMMTYLLTHELIHHTGIDTLIREHFEELKPLLKSDLKSNKELLDGIKAMRSAKTDQELMAKAKKLGLQDSARYQKLMIETARAYPDDMGESLGHQMARIAQNTHMLLASFQAISSSFAVTKGTYDVADEILPSVLCLQAVNGAAWMREAMPKTYPKLEEILRQKGLEISHSAAWPAPIPDRPDH